MRERLMTGRDKAAARQRQYAADNDAIADRLACYPDVAALYRRPPMSTGAVRMSSRERGNDGRNDREIQDQEIQGVPA